MRELTLTEIEDVNGGVVPPVVVVAGYIVAGAAGLAVVGFVAGVAAAYYFY